MAVASGDPVQQCIDAMIRERFSFILEDPMASPATDIIRQRIVALLREQKHPMYAHDIANALQTSKKTINQVLYKSDCFAMTHDTTGTPMWESRTRRPAPVKPPDMQRIAAAAWDASAGSAGPDTITVDTAVFFESRVETEKDVVFKGSGATRSKAILATLIKAVAYYQSLCSSES